MAYVMTKGLTVGSRRRRRRRRRRCEPDDRGGGEEEEQKWCTKLHFLEQGDLHMKK